MSVSVWTRKSHHICLTSSSKSARQRSATSQLTMITKVRDITTISSDNQHSTMIRQFPRQQSTERTNTEFKSVRLPSLIQVFYAMTMKLFSTECCSSRVLTTEHVRRILTTILNISVNNRNFINSRSDLSEAYQSPFCITYRYDICNIEVYRL